MLDVRAKCHPRCPQVEVHRVMLPGVVYDSAVVGTGGLQTFRETTTLQRTKCT